jgi:hypothetical protein
MIRDAHFNLVHRTLEQQSEISTVLRVDIYTSPLRTQLAMTWDDGSTYIGWVDSEEAHQVIAWAKTQATELGWPTPTIHFKEPK